MSKNKRLWEVFCDGERQSEETEKEPNILICGKTLTKPLQSAQRRSVCVIELWYRSVSVLCTGVISLIRLRIIL